MSVSSGLCPYAVMFELLHYPCCKIQNYTPVSCPPDYEKCPIFENNNIKNNIMKFKGTIIITDPGYLASGNKFLESTDHWWDETDLGENLHEIGITSYISEDTLYGDWSCFTYKGLKEEVQDKINEWNKYYFEFFKKYNLETDDKKREEILSEYTNYSSKFVKENTFGKFCADTGKVCVCYLEDVLKFNPNFKEWMETHPWCVTVIENFDGDIKYEVDENNEAHIVGMGNINFYTSQSGL